jgi:hypothetical protein
MFGHHKKENSMSFSGFAAVVEEIINLVTEMESDGTFTKLETFISSAESDLKDNPAIQALLTKLKSLKL